MESWRIISVPALLTCTVDGTTDSNKHRPVRLFAARDTRKSGPCPVTTSDFPARDDTFVFFDAIFLQHPLDRLRSMYEFLQRAGENGDGDPLPEHARRLDLGRFMELLLTHYPHVINDSQVNYLARGGQYTRPRSRADLEKAHRIVTDAAIPGVIEILDVSLKAAEYYLYPAFGRLKLEYTPQNVSPDRAESLDVRLRTYGTSVWPGDIPRALGDECT